MNGARIKVAEQTYSFAELCRILHLPRKRANELRAIGELPGPDVVIPGGGHKGERWTASRIGFVQAKWNPNAA